MASGAARYDGHSAWYDQAFSVFHPPGEELAFLRQALGTGHGQVCIDLACGTGLCAQPIADAGYRGVGFDISADQLRFARRRLGAVARADACLLPVRDESVPVVAGMFFHTDLEDFAAAARKVARCLRRPGRFIYAGLHPCFIGPLSTGRGSPPSARFISLRAMAAQGGPTAAPAMAPGWAGGLASITRRWQASSAPSPARG
jgi:SAM-dependent methyltransferase